MDEVHQAWHRVIYALSVNPFYIPRFSAHPRDYESLRMARDPSGNYRRDQHTPFDHRQCRRQSSRTITYKLQARFTVTNVLDNKYSLINTLGGTSPQPFDYQQAGRRMMISLKLNL